MGREWYWGGRSTKRKETESPGCMNGVLQLFDFQHFQLPMSHQPCFKPSSFIQEEPIILKGVEAPRNSLESEEGLIMGAASLSSSEMKEEERNIPMDRAAGRGGGHSIARSEELYSSESSSSPRTKTPNLVARLMGLDLLPETFSPSPSPSFSSRQPLQSRTTTTTIDKKKNKNNFVETEVRYEMTGSRSLPDTPRISSARRSDVDHRLSLQINKENIMINEEFDYFSGVSARESFLCSPSLTTKQRKKEWRVVEEDNRSPSNYARQLVKQVKESVSRKVGVDITNTVASKNKSIEGDGQTLKSKKPRPSPDNQSTPLCSPRLRFLEPKSKPVSISQDQPIKSPRPLSKPRLLSVSPPPPPPPTSLVSYQTKASVSPPPSSLVSYQAKSKVSAKPKIEKCKKPSCERRETFVRTSSTTTKANLNLTDKKSKKTPISNDLVPAKKVSKAVQASKPSSQLSSGSSRSSYEQQATPDLDDRDDSTNRRTGDSAEFRYISEILKCTGIEWDTNVSFTRCRWFSPCHPLHPSLFHHLDHSFLSITTTTTTTTTTTDQHLGQLRHQCNRKLLFQLLDEILAEILRPYLNMKPWLSSINNTSSFVHKQVRGDQLLQQLWSEIRSFPSANCQILQDIDALIEKDLPIANMRTLPISEDSESIVFEIERDILDSLVLETAAAVFAPPCEVVGKKLTSLPPTFRTETAPQSQWAGSDTHVTWAFT